MKHFFTTRQPEGLIEDWPGKYAIFSWLEFAITVPNPIYVVTTEKPGGVPNANLQSWGMPLNEGGKNHFLMAILRRQHTYENILRTGEWCVNYLPRSLYALAERTIDREDGQKALLRDEIRDAGLDVYESRVVSAPGIAQSKIILECRRVWNRPLVEGSAWELFCGAVVGVHADADALTADPERRIANLELMYNVRGTVNPLDGSFYGPNTLGVLDTVEKVTEETADNTGL